MAEHAHNTRRAFLKCAPLALAGIAAAGAATADKMSAVSSLPQRRDELIKQLASTLQDLTGTAWDVKNNPKLGVVVMVDTYDRTGAGA